MKHTKLLTSTCVLLAGLYSGSVLSAPSVRAGTTGTTTGGTVARAGTLRVQPTARNVSVAQKSTSASADAARLASLPGIGTNKLSVNPKLPSNNAAAVADLRSAIEELSLTTTSTANALSSVQSGLEKLQDSAIDSEVFEAGIREAKDYTDTTAGTLETEKIQPLARSIEDVSVTISNVASKDYVDEQVATVALTAFNEEQVNRVITNKLATENYKGYTDDKMSTVVTTRIVPLETAVGNIDIDMDMRVADDEIQYKSAKATEWKKLANVTDFSGIDGVTPRLAKDDARKVITVQYGTESPIDLIAYADITGPQGEQGAQGAQGLQGLAGDDACKEITSEYKTPSESAGGGAYKQPGYLLVTTTDSCENMVEQYKQDDHCWLAEFNYTADSAFDTYYCKPQQQGAADYKLVKSANPVSKSVKDLTATLVLADDESELPNSFKVKFAAASQASIETDDAPLNKAFKEKADVTALEAYLEKANFAAEFNQNLTKQKIENQGFETAETAATKYLQTANLGTALKNASLKSDVKTAVENSGALDGYVGNDTLTTQLGTIGTALDSKLTKSELGTELNKAANQQAVKDAVEGSGALNSYVTSDTLTTQLGTIGTALDSKLTKSELRTELNKAANKQAVKDAVENSEVLDGYVNTTNFDTAVNTSLDSGALKAVKDTAIAAQSTAEGAKATASAALPSVDFNATNIELLGFPTSAAVSTSLSTKADKLEVVLNSGSNANSFNTLLNNSEIIQRVKANVLGDCSKAGTECKVSLEDRIDAIEARLTVAGF